MLRMQVSRSGSAAEAADHLGLRGIDELVHRHDPLQHVAAVDEDARVAGEAGGIAGDRRDARHLRGGKRLRLRLCAGARRIEDDPVEAVELGRGEREGKEVAPLRRPPRFSPLARRSAACRASSAAWLLSTA